MFDIGADELLLTAVVAIVVIGPKDLPRALRTLGRWTAKMRRMSNAFRSGIENVIREAELEEMEKQWREQNAAIMAAHPTVTPDTDAEAAAAASVGETLAVEHAPVVGPVAEPTPLEPAPVQTPHEEPKAS
jgi:sec-independent protein translocase protein TatB